MMAVSGGIVGGIIGESLAYILWLFALAGKIYT